MKTIVKSLLVSALFVFCLMGQCTHQHDEKCGNEGINCGHENGIVKPRVDKVPPG